MDNEERALWEAEQVKSQIQQVFEGWANLYDENMRFTFDLSLFMYPTRLLAENVVAGLSHQDKGRLIGGRPRRVRIEILE